MREAIWRNFNDLLSVNVTIIEIELLLTTYIARYLCNNWHFSTKTRAKSLVFCNIRVKIYDPYWNFNLKSILSLVWLVKKTRKSTFIVNILVFQYRKMYLDKNCLLVSELDSILASTQRIGSAINSRSDRDRRSNQIVIWSPITCWFSRSLFHYISEKMMN